MGVHMELITETLVVKEGAWPERGCTEEERGVASYKPGEGEGGRIHRLQAYFKYLKTVETPFNLLCSSQAFAL